jgi:hypothetical protein
VSAATARKITLLIDGIRSGTGKLWDGVVIDCGTRWSKDPALTEAVNYRIECAIRRGGEAMSMNIELTTESSMSSHGQLVLRICTDDSIEDYRPGDWVSTSDGMRLANDIVVDWLNELGRTDEDVELGQRFLAVGEFP